MTLRSPSDKSRAQEILDNKAVYISDLATFSLVMSAHGCAVPYRGPYAHDRGLSGPPVHGDDHARTGHRRGCGRDCVRMSARAHADGGAGGYAPDRHAYGNAHDHARAHGNARGCAHVFL